MNLEIFTTCRQFRNNNGLIDLLGIHQSIRADRTPFSLPACKAVISLIFTKLDAGDHTLRILLTDEDSSVIYKSEAIKLSVDVPNDVGIRSYTHVFDLRGIELPEYGEYAIDLYINQRMMTRRPYYLRPLEAQ